MRNNSVRIKIRVLSSCRRECVSPYQVWINATHHLSSIWEHDRYV